MELCRPKLIASVIAVFFIAGGARPTPATAPISVRWTGELPGSCCALLTVAIASMSLIFNFLGMRKANQ